jgi:GAF domain-containing protein
MLLSAYKREPKKPARGGSQDPAKSITPAIQRLIENSSEAVLILDADRGRVLEVNHGAISLFHNERDQLVRRTFVQLSARKQPGGLQPSKLFAEQKALALQGSIPIFEWSAQTGAGRTSLCEVQFAKLAVKETNLIRANIINMEPIAEELKAQPLFSDGENTDELAALALAGASIASSLDLGKVLQVVAQQLSTLLAVQVCFISDWDSVTGSLKPRTELIQKQNRNKISASSISDGFDLKPVLEKIRPLQKRVGESQLSIKEKRLLKESGVQTVLFLPLIAQSKTIGLVELQDLQTSRTFGSREIYLAQTLCHQAAVAIENARLFQATRRQVQELRILHEVALAATEAKTEDELIDRATQLIRENIYSDNFGILLLADNGTEIYIHRSYESAPDVVGKRIPLGKGVTGRVAATGIPMRIADSRQENNYLNYDQATLSELCVPMKIGDRIIGVINTESRQVDRFTEDDERLLVTLAGQLATGIERLRNAMAEQRRAKQLAVLNELTAQMSGVLEREKLFKVVVESLNRRMGYFSTDISRADEEQKAYVIEAVSGAFEAFLPREGFNQPFGTGLLDQAYRDGNPVISNDVKHDPRYHAVSGFAKINSELVIPIKIYKKVVALLNIESTEVNAFDDYEVAALSTLGDQISMSLESINLFESTRRQLQELTVLHAITQAAVNAKSEDELLERATEIIGASLYTDKFGFLLLDADKQELRVHRSYRGIDSQTKSRIVPLTQGVTGKVASTGKPSRVPDVRKEPSYMRVNPQMRSELCVPILGNNNQVLGVINTESMRLDAFTESDMRLLSTIAGQTGNAIEKLRLYAAEREQRGQAETLREVAAILSSTAETEEVLGLILEQLKRVVPFDSASLQLIKNDKLKIHAVSGNLDRSAIGFELPIARDKFAHPLIFEQRTVLYEDISEHPDWMRAPGAESVKSWIGAPLIARGEAIGVLTVDGYESKQFTAADAQLVSSFAIHAGIALENARLFDEAQEAYVQTVSALASAIDVRDTYTSGHSQRLVDLSVETGRLLGCESQELTDIRWGALLHDIGKIGVPDEILRKPAALEKAEIEIIRKHPEIGARIVEPVRNLANVAPIIRAHQERFDGKGYPDGLKGQAIPKIARIISVADAYVAMTDDRVYRPARSKEEAIAELKRCSGSQFDPKVVDAFLVALSNLQENKTKQ